MRVLSVVSSFRGFHRGILSGMINFGGVSVQPGLEDPSLSSWWSPSCHHVFFSIWTIFASGVNWVSYWFLGPLLKMALEFLWGLICDGEQRPWKYSPLFMSSLSLYE